MYADQGRRTVYEEAAGNNKKAERIGMKIETLTGNTVYFPYITVGRVEPSISHKAGCPPIICYANGLAAAKQCHFHF